MSRVHVRTAPFIPLGLVLAALAARAEEVRLPVSADNSICCHPDETDDNLGASSRIKMKGIENILFLNFDPAPLKGKQVTKAVVRIKATDRNVMVRKVGFSTIATPWAEGKQGSEKKAADGDSSFRSPEAGSGRNWAGPGSNVLDAIWGRGGTIWTQSYVKPDDQMWFEMEFDGRLLEACALGLGFGLAVSDDNGQTKSGHKDVVPDSNFANNWFCSREHNNAQPVFLATVAPAAAPEPARLDVQVKPWPGGADFESGGLEVSWPGPRDEAEAKAQLGCKVKLSVGGGEYQELPRWMHPPLARAGERVRALIKGQPAGAKVKAQVQVFRHGFSDSVAAGEGNGEVSAKLRTPEALEVAKLERPAGEPPANEAARVWALPDGVKANPVTGNVLEEAGVVYEGNAAGKYSQSNAAWSGAQKTAYLAGLCGEWVAFQLVCQNAAQGPVEYKVTPGDLKGPGGAAIPAAAVQLSRLWYQKTGKGERGWYGDPLVPIKAGETFKVPDLANAVPNQANQTVYVEFFVPKDAAPGVYTGPLAVQAGAGAPLELTVKLEVGVGRIPDRACFVWSMNAYSSPGTPYGKPGSPEFIEAERSFYTMSHLHRTCLAVLHYSHGGTYADGCALPLEGQGKQMRVKDWSAWDQRFGPLFDASAFKGTPREGLALDHFYLVLSEHYPTPMAEGYKWNNAVWENHWKVAGPIEEGFSPQYQDQWTTVAADHLKHFQEKGWQTRFQIYLNDKYFYKQYDPKRKAHGRGVCFWLLDEPMHVDDFTALAFFGKLFRQAQAAAGAQAAKTMAFRVDVSRPQWGRDTLDRVVDLNVTGGFSDYRPWLEDWRERYGQAVWTYGGAPESTGSALGIAAQALDLYGRGVDGFVPWLTLGGEGNWQNFEATCVFYTGKPRGIAGACASLRLKQYRRGEQDVEYVRLFAEKTRLLKDDPSRQQVGRLLRGTIQMTKKLGTLDSQGAVTESFSGLRPEDFEQLRRALAKALAAP